MPRAKHQHRRSEPAPTITKVAQAEPATDDDAPAARSHGILLALILLSAVVTRFYGIAEYSLWLDEIWTIETATARGSPHLLLPEGVIITEPPVLTSLDGAPPWWRIWTSMREMTHPPLYLIVLRWWMEAFGTGPMAVRSLSAVSSVIAVLLLYDVVRLQLSSRGAAAWAAVLLIVAGPQVQFAQEVRPYAFMVMLALAAADALVRVERLGATPLRLAAFAAALLALMLTHYFALGTAAAMGAYFVLRTRGTKRRRLLVAVACAAMIFAIAWGPFMWGHRSTFSDVNTRFLHDPAGRAGGGHVLRTLGWLIAVPARLFSDYVGEIIPAIGVTTVVIALAVYASRKRQDLLMWCLWLGGTVGLVALLDLTRGTRHLHFMRYTLLAGPALYAIAAALAWHAGAYARHVLPATIALVCAAMLPGAGMAMWKANWRDLAREFEQSLRPGDVLVVAGSDPTYSRGAYLCISHFATKPRPPFALVTGRADDALVAQLRAAPGVVLFTQEQAIPNPQFVTLGECDATIITGRAGAGGVMRITWAEEKAGKGSQ